MLGPSMTMGMASLFTGLFSYYNVVSSGGDIKQAIPSLVMAGSMLCGTVLWPVFTKIYEKKKRRKSEEMRQKKYVAYLEQKRQEIAEESYVQKEILKENFSSLAECENRILEQRRNLWERMDSHNDFLHIRLGIGDLPMDLELKFPEKRFLLDDDVLQDSLYKLAEQPQILSQVPVTVSLKEQGIVGIIGERSRVLGAYSRPVRSHSGRRAADCKASEKERTGIEGRTAYKILRDFYLLLTQIWFKLL